MESTRDQVPSSVKTEQKRLNETETVRLTPSVAVVNQLEKTTDLVPNPVETEQEGLSETKTVQLPTSDRKSVV